MLADRRAPRVGGLQVSSRDDQLAGLRAIADLVARRDQHVALDAA
jgi:hypothetical protein